MEKVQNLKVLNRKKVKVLLKVRQKAEILKTVLLKKATIQQRAKILKTVLLKKLKKPRK